MLENFSDKVNIINKVTIYGNNQVDYLVVDVPETIEVDNYIKSKNISGTGEGVKFFASDYCPEWITTETENLLDNPMLVVNFDNESINTSTSSVPEGFEIVGYRLFRKEFQLSPKGKLVEVTQKSLGTFSGVYTGIKDYTIKNNSFYQWLMYPRLKKQSDGKYYLSTVVTTEIEGSNILNSRSEFNSWTVVFLTKENNSYYVDSDTGIFTFNCNTQGGTITQNMDKTQFDNYTQFPKISVGEKNYTTGTLSCLLSKVSYRENETSAQQEIRDTLGYDYAYYDEDIYKWNLWCDYVASGKPCLIKDPKGHMLIANIMSNTGSAYTHAQNPPTTISFTFVEIDDASEQSVIRAYT